ncbi:protein CASC3-like isoform X1 [Cotesia glomerata]|uniref:Protein CASC3 n=1 Tax=Cotesia glomerata TaxID=32391 RepID=A0AAV7J5Y8_COTGL|nr:protein CASC3-like isoform X1 [Cotesia glomerata]KAH0567013.1 hypothetical protein KQX54_006051 [Cotesia glomerata]
MIKSDPNMSDTRRRRHKSERSHASDDLSESFDELAITKDTASNDQSDITIHHDSEYDTAGSDGESDGGSQDGVQRERGDGQEEDKPQKKLDDDEDRRNPQYIPKRGTFYEHDDRTTEEAAEDTVEQPVERESKDKKVWKDKEDRWDHDRYNDQEQAPKSHEELIAVYGYDIRNEEGPPRARRRRRYGRGPNKYTRNWEDEDAYGKTPINTSTKQNRRLNKTGEEFPALGGSVKDDKQDAVEEPVISSAWYSNKNKYSKQQNAFPPLQSQLDNQRTILLAANDIHTNENKAPNEPTNPAWKKDAKYSHQSLIANINAGDDIEKTTTANVKPAYVNKRQVQESVSLAASRVRGRGFKPTANNNLVANRPPDTKPKGRGSGLITGGDRRNIMSRDDDQFVNEVKHINVNDGSTYHHGRQQKTFYGQGSNQQRPNVGSPRMQPPTQQHQQQQQQQQPQAHSRSPSEMGGNRPKRYSSLRQRPAISDGPGQQNYPTQHNQHGQHSQHGPHGQHNQLGQHGFYSPQGGNSHGVIESQGYPQNHFDQSPQVPQTANTLAPQSVMPLPSAGQPGSFAPPPFLVPTPQFIAPQTAAPSIINYVQAPNGPAFPPNFQGYQGYTPSVQPPVPQPPPELYQPQGCTYYSPAQQPQQVPQIAPLRRPKAAIPILPPPDNNSVQRQQSSRGRGRNVSQASSCSGPGSQLSPSEQQQQHQHQQFQQIDTQQCVSVESINNSSNDIYNNLPVEHVEQISESMIPQMPNEETNIFDESLSLDNKSIVENIREDNDQSVETVLIEKLNENITENFTENINENLEEKKSDIKTDNIEEIISNEPTKENIDINNLNNDLMDKTNETDNDVVSITKNDCENNIDETVVVIDNNSNNSLSKTIEVDSVTINQTDMNNKVENVVSTPVVEEAAA